MPPPSLLPERAKLAEFYSAFTAGLSRRHRGRSFHRRSHQVLRDVVGGIKTIGDISRELKLTHDAVLASVGHLTSMGMLVSQNRGNSWLFSAMGREFLRACYPE